MAESQSIAILGFMPWADPARQIAVRENPSAIVADLCARELAASGLPAAFVPVEVSGDGITKAMEMVRLLGAQIVVALGQTPTEPRVERLGRVPGLWAPAAESEVAPWSLAPDADELVIELNRLQEPAAELKPFRASDDAGAYFCDHLCVELVRDARVRGTKARFLHITAVDGCPPDVREARLLQYTRQARATVEWLMRSSFRGPYG